MMCPSTRSHVGRLALLACLAWALPAGAHTTSDSYLTLRAASHGLDARWDLSIKDLDFAIGLDDDNDGAVTWRELDGAKERVFAYAAARLDVRANGASCAPRLDTQQVVRRHGETYAALRVELRCDGGAPSAVEVEYAAFFDENPSHRGLLVVEHALGTETAVFRPSDNRVRFSLSGEGGPRRSVGATLGTYVIEGVWHVLIGFDHVLFLLALLLPSVLRRSDRRWQPRDGLRGVVGDVLRVVTAFTVAHSVTLCLAATGVTRLPSSFVEAGIALSVLVVALNNVAPVFRDDRWTVAFALGLLHGFGFSSVLLELGLDDARLVWSLLGFNVGVELGQLAVVAAFLPIAFSLRRSWLYQRVVLVGGSLLIALIALLWSVERAFSVSLLPSGGFPW